MHTRDSLLPVRILSALALALVSSGASAQSASMVVRDADTGKLRAPTAEEARLLTLPRQAEGARAAVASTQARGVISGSTTPMMISLGNGMIMAETTEDMMSGSVAVRGHDGKLIRQCAGSGAMAERLAKGGKLSFAKNMLERHYADR